MTFIPLNAVVEQALNINLTPVRETGNYGQRVAVCSLGGCPRIGEARLRNIGCRMTLAMRHRALRLELPESADLLSCLEQARVILLLDLCTDLIQLHQ